MLGSDGGIFTFGDAGYFGSIQEIVNNLLGPGYPSSAWLSAPIVGLAPTPTGLGYWLVASDGGMFTFGDAAYHGSVPGVLPPGVGLNQPVVGLVTQADRYLLVAADGGIFNFGDSDFLGSIPGLGASGIDAAVVLPSGGDVTAVMVSPTGDGYTMLGRDGIIWPFGVFSTRFAGLTQADLSVPSYPGDVKNCGDFDVWPQAQRWFDTYSPFYGDPAQLDSDGDRVACESLPPDYPTITAGTHLVGSEVYPGTYRTSAGQAGCNWERLKGLSGSLLDVIASGYTGVTAIVTIDPGDVAFSTNAACGTWTMDLSPVTASPTAAFGGGAYQVGSEVAPGTGLSDATRWLLGDLSRHDQERVRQHPDHPHDRGRGRRVLGRRGVRDLGDGPAPHHRVAHGRLRVGRLPSGNRCRSGDVGRERRSRVLLGAALGLLGVVHRGDRQRVHQQPHFGRHRPRRCGLRHQRQLRYVDQDRLTSPRISRDGTN